MRGLALKGLSGESEKGVVISRFDLWSFFCFFLLQFRFSYQHIHQTSARLIFEITISGHQ